PELRAWAIGAAGRDVPLPPGKVEVIGARKIDILNRRAALVRVRIGGDEVTYLVQHARGLPPEEAERKDGDLEAVEWRQGPYTCVAVGPAASKPTWLPALRGKP